MKFTSPKAVKYANLARERWGYLTPFRLGLVVGEAADRLRVHYKGHARTLYEQGLAYGNETRERKAERIREEAIDAG